MLLRKKRLQEKKQQNYMGTHTQELHFNRAVIRYSVSYSRSKLIILLWSDFGWGALKNLQTNQTESSGS